MDIEEFRAFCLSFAGARDAFPFGKAASAYDRDILVFYAGDKWFCFVNAVMCDFCTLRCPTDRIPALQAQYEGIGPGWHMDQRPFRQRRARNAAARTGRSVVRTGEEPAGRAAPDVEK